MTRYQERTYRNLISSHGALHSYNVTIRESDLFISSSVDMSAQIEKSLLKQRTYLETYINNNPQFLKSLLPLPYDEMAPPIIRDMLDKSRLCGVGPMASVAGAVSQFIGLELMNMSETLIIENGGDIFLKSPDNLNVSVYAGESPLSYKVNFAVKASEQPLGICTSSATVGPSLNFGKADAICVISPSATLSDAAASAIGNRVKDKKDIKPALEFGMTIKDITGIIIIYGSDMGAIGDIEFV